MSTYQRKLRPVVRLYGSAPADTHWKGLAVIVFDPDPTCAFAPGATLSAVPQMLREAAFSPGTELSIDGAHYVVRMGDDGRQRLVEAG